METYFTENPVLDRHMHHMNNTVPAPIFYGIAVGDDSELIREGNSVIDVARPLSDEFEDEEWEDPILCSFPLAA